MTNDSAQLNELRKMLSEDKAEWAESLDAIVEQYGAAGAREILRSLQNHVLGLNIPLDEATLNTPYRNTITLDAQPAYPGDIALEEKLEKVLRWNAYRHGAASPRQRHWGWWSYRDLCLLRHHARGWL
jgi:pyruvate dehydrogenase complex dehydrogenase (E1) component